MRRSPNAVGLVALFAGLLVLHYSLRPLLGCLAGLAADALSPSSFGAAAIAMTGVGFAASWLKASFFDEHIALNAVFLLLGKLGFDAVFLLAERRLSVGPLLLQLGVWSLLSAVITAVAGLAVLVLFRPIIDVGARHS